MNKHLTTDELEGYRSRDLPHEVFMAADRHLGDCDSCRRLLRGEAGQVRLPDLLEELPDSLHPDYERLSLYVDELLGPEERESMESHLLICASCSKELLDLEELEARWKMPAVPVQKEALPMLSSWLESLSKLFASPWRVRQLGMASVMVALGCFVLLQADRLGKAGSVAAGEAARLVQPVIGAHSFWGLGGFVLMAAGVAILVHAVFKKRP